MTEGVVVTPQDNATTETFRSLEANYLIRGWNHEGPPPHAGGYGPGLQGAPIQPSLRDGFHFFGVVRGLKPPATFVRSLRDHGPSSVRGGRGSPVHAPGAAGGVIPKTLLVPGFPSIPGRVCERLHIHRCRGSSAVFEWEPLSAGPSATRWAAISSHPFSRAADRVLPNSDRRPATTGRARSRPVPAHFTRNSFHHGGRSGYTGGFDGFPEGQTSRSPEEFAGSSPPGAFWEHACSMWRSVTPSRRATSALLRISAPSGRTITRGCRRGPDNVPASASGSQDSRVFAFTPQSYQNARSRLRREKGVNFRKSGGTTGGGQNGKNRFPWPGAGHFVAE